MRKIAAIDVGPYVVRMVFGTVNGPWQVESIENVRLAVRLGRGVFTSEYPLEGTI